MVASKKLLSLVLAVGLAISAADASVADIVVGYAAANVSTSLTAAPGTGVTGHDLNRGSGIIYSSNMAGYSSESFVGGTDDDSLNWSFTLGSYEFDLTTLQVKTARTGTGPSSLRLDFAIGAGSFTTVGTQAIPATATDTVFDLSSLANVTGATYNFRLVGLGATNNGGTFRIDNSGNYSGTSDLAVNGTLVAVPEASAFVYGGLIAIGLCGWKWRQNRRVEQALA
jgi:hypothetical protein